MKSAAIENEKAETRRRDGWKERNLPRPPAPMTLDEYEQHLAGIGNDGGPAGIQWTLGLGEIRAGKISPPPGVTIAGETETETETETVIEDEQQGEYGTAMVSA